MKKIFLVLFLMGGATLWADELKPPVPMPAGDGLDVLPPPVDINQLPLPDATKSPESSKNAAPEAVPTAVPAKAPAVKKKSAAAKVENGPAEKPKSESAAPTPAASTGSPQAVSVGPFAEYFPTTQGTKWTYEYLKVAPGSKAKKTRVVECTAQEQTASGLQAAFQVTEDGKTTEEKFSLADNKVAQISQGAEALSGEFAYQLPEKGAPSHWSSTGKTCKASFGEAEVYKKKYPDCVIVTEKTSTSTIISYYAKGIGLLSVEFYGKNKKLKLTDSFALISGPGGASK